MPPMRCRYCSKAVTADNFREFHVAWGAYGPDMFDVSVVCLPSSGGCWLTLVSVIGNLEVGAHVADHPLPLTRRSAQRIVRTYWPSSRGSYSSLMSIAERCSTLNIDPNHQE